MADVVVICPKCNREVTVSEFVDLASLKCVDCKEQMIRKDVPQAIMAQQQKEQQARKLTFKKIEPPAPAPVQQPQQGTEAPESISVATQVISQAAAQAAAAAPPSGWQVTQDAKRQLMAREKKAGIGPAGWSWIIFIFLGGIMGAVRYGGILPPVLLANFQIIGPIIFAIIALFAILEAFHDSIFSGILCLLVPLYWVYHLFTVSDNFYFRAIAGGLLVGIGEDSAYFYWQWVLNVIDAGNRAIRGV